jgi:hypothetical protein
MDSNNEAKLQQARAKRGQQDAKTPFLINRENGRLLPNVARTAKHRNMIPYTGSVKASLEERMRWIRTGGNTRRNVTSSAPIEELPPFDVSTASKEELIDFAKEEFGLVLNPKAPPHIMRNQILAAAAKEDGGEAPATAPAAVDEDLG